MSENKLDCSGLGINTVTLYLGSQRSVSARIRIESFSHSPFRLRGNVCRNRAMGSGERVAGRDPPEGQSPGNPEGDPEETP